MILSTQYLSCLAKILETLINSQLRSFSSLYGILNVHQSGFRTGHSTISAASLLINDIVSSLDKKCHCAALYIDLLKAFDTVDHKLLTETICYWS